MKKGQRRHYFKLMARIGKLFFIEPSDFQPLVEKSYDRISITYDETWTGHMRDLTEGLIEKLDPQPNSTCIDLTCGTGYATNLIAQKTQNTVTGIDASEGMLTQGRNNYSQSCEFIQSDILEYLKSLKRDSVDIVTCCWGLGYSKPFAALCQVKRILKPGGKVAIIDNSLFSLREIMYCSFLTFAEHPDKLKNLMRFRFLPNAFVLNMMFRILGFKPSYSANGSKPYTVDSGKSAIERLRATGAAAGFEYACNPEDERLIFERFAEIIEDKYLKDGKINVTHRYLAGIAQK